MFYLLKKNSGKFLLVFDLKFFSLHIAHSERDLDLSCQLTGNCGNPANLPCCWEGHRAHAGGGRPRGRQTASVRLPPASFLRDREPGGLQVPWGRPADLSCTLLAARTVRPSLGRKTLPQQEAPLSGRCLAGKAVGLAGRPGSQPPLHDFGKTIQLVWLNVPPRNRKWLSHLPCWLHGDAAR